jgi:DedD protein
MDEERLNNLNNVLLDKQYEQGGVNLKKIIIIGLILFAISAGIVVSIGMINKDDNFETSLIEPSVLEKNTIRKSNPALFKEAEQINEIIQPNKKEANGAKARGITSDLIKQLTQKNKEEKIRFANTNNPIKKELVNKDISPTRDIRNLGQKSKQINPPIVTTKGIKEKVKRPKRIQTEKIQRGFYVQVGAFYTTIPEDSFLNKIKSLGYGYSFYKLKINAKDVTKVLVGPYQNKYDALSELSSIKRTLEKNAFILKMN